MAIQTEERAHTNAWIDPRDRERLVELARIMGTSVGMIEAHYGALIDTARESLLDRLETFVASEWHDAEASEA